MIDGKNCKNSIIPRDCDIFLWTPVYIPSDLSSFVYVCSTAKSESQRQKIVTENL